MFLKESQGQDSEWLTNQLELYVHCVFRMIGVDINFFFPREPKPETMKVAAAIWNRVELEESKVKIVIAFKPQVAAIIIHYFNQPWPQTLVESARPFRLSDCRHQTRKKKKEPGNLKVL